MSVNWQPVQYDSLPLPHEKWGARVVAGFEFSGSEILVDAGCGTGRDAQLALSRLPEGNIIGLDASPSMRVAFQQRFSGDGQVSVLAANLDEPWPVTDGSVDAVMSVAAFHWIPDHSRVWSHAATAMKPGGVIRVDAGGAGNLTRLLAAVDEVGATPLLPSWHYAGVDETLGHLRAAGLEPVTVELRQTPTQFDDDLVYADYLRSIVLHRLTEIQRMQVASIMADRVVDYVRLEVEAVKPSD
jgi:trans-aconitate 2-methyltransferase